MVAIGLSCGDCLSCEEVTGCTIGEDTFNRPDNIDPNQGAPFTWGGMTFDILLIDNELIFTSGLPERLTCPNANPDGGSGVVSAKFSADIGDEVEVWLNGTDADNCTVARLTIGTSQPLEIISRTSGVDTVLESTTVHTNDFQYYTLTLYYEAALSRARAVVGDFSLCAFDIPEAGDLAGISIGVNAGVVYANDFLYQKLGDGENDCPEMPEGCGFNPCARYPLDSGWEAVLTISGVGNTIFCEHCDSVINNTFVIPLTNSGNTQTRFERFTTANLCAGNDRFHMWVYLDCAAQPDNYPGDSPSGIHVLIQSFEIGSQGSWRLATPEFPDMFRTYHSSEFIQVFASATYCDYFGATFTLSFNPP